MNTLFSSSVTFTVIMLIVLLIILVASSTAFIIRTKQTVKIRDYINSVIISFETCTVEHAKEFKKLYESIPTKHNLRSTIFDKVISPNAKLDIERMCRNGLFTKLVDVREKMAAAGCKQIFLDSYAPIGSTLAKILREKDFSEDFERALDLRDAVYRLYEDFYNDRSLLLDQKSLSPWMDFGVASEIIDRWLVASVAYEIDYINNNNADAKQYQKIVEAFADNNISFYRLGEKREVFLNLLKERAALIRAKAKDQPTFDWALKLDEYILSIESEPQPKKENAA